MLLYVTSASGVSDDGNDDNQFVSFGIPLHIYSSYLTVVTLCCDQLYILICFLIVMILTGNLFAHINLLLYLMHLCVILLPTCFDTTYVYRNVLLK